VGIYTATLRRKYFTCASACGAIILKQLRRNYFSSFKRKCAFALFKHRFE